jgi:ubiquitin carboxyl-terminal hydrolase 5/13
MAAPATTATATATPIDEALLDRVRAGMRGLRAPGHHDRVYKEECVFSFDTPYSPGGLYVNLKTFQVN